MIFSVQAADSEGNDISDQFSIEVQSDSPLHVHVVRAREEGVPETECTGVVTLRADGDADADEEFPIVGTLSFIYDAPNATGFEMTGQPI